MTGYGFDILKNPDWLDDLHNTKKNNKVNFSDRNLGTNISIGNDPTAPTSSSKSVPNGYSWTDKTANNAQNKNTATKTTVQTKTAATAAPQKQERQVNMFQTSEPARTKTPLYGNTYDWEKDQKERLQRFGIGLLSSDSTQQQAPAMIRKTSAIDPDAEEFTPEGEAAFLEGLNSIYEDDTQVVPYKNTSNTESRDERDVRVREQYAARERQIDFSDRNALAGELADIEGAEDHNPDSKWYKRLERAWESGDLETYEKVEREMAMQKKRVKYILENRDRTYDDNFAGQFGASYRAGRIAQDEALAWNKYLESPTILNKEYAQSVSEMSELFRQNNAETLADDAALPWLSQSLAGYLPQLADQTGAGLTGAAGTGLTAGFMATASGNPLVAGATALKGAKAGYTAGVTAHSYDVMRGSAYKKLLDKGMDEKSARAKANDEAFLSSLIEMADSGVDVNTAVDIILNPKVAGIKGALKLLGNVGINVAGESVEEGLQEGVSIANENRDGTGFVNLLGNTGSTISSAITNADSSARQRMLDAMSEGAKLSLMTAGPGIVAGNAIDSARPKSLKPILDASEKPLEELKRRADDIAKTAPIKIPNTATIKAEYKEKGYYQMPYVWNGNDGFTYKSRWHTKTPGAPFFQKDTWVVERKIPGIGYGKNKRDSVHQFLIGKNEWISKNEWLEACTANTKRKRYGQKMTKRQREVLKNGHHKA